MSPRKLLVLLALLLTACCPLGKNCWPVQYTEKGDQVKLQMVAAQGWYPNGSTIKLSFSVQNTTKNTITFSRTDGPVVDIVSEWDKTQRWSASGEDTVDIHTLTLLPSETRTLEWEYVPPYGDKVYIFDGMIWLWGEESLTPVVVGVGSVEH